MYKFIGKKGQLYILDIKLNSNCKQEEKNGTGPGSCSGSKDEIQGNIYIDENGKKFDFSDPDKEMDFKETIAFQKYIKKRHDERINGSNKHGFSKEIIKSVDTNKSIKKDNPLPLSKKIINKPYLEETLLSSQSKLSDSEKDILLKYTIPDSEDIETSFEYINTYASRIDEAPDATIETIHSIDKIMEKTSLPAGKTYRGLVNQEAEAILKSGKSGYKLPGFISTSIDKNIAKDFGRKYLLEIDVPKGSKGVFLTEGMADTPHEKELLLNRNYKIVATSTSEDKETGKTIIHTKIV